MPTMPQRLQPFAPTRRAATAAAAAGVVLIAGLLASGCGRAGAEQPTARDRQDKAVKDPFGYSQDNKNSDMTVSGRGELDKPGLKRDFDHVINP